MEVVGSLLNYFSNYFRLTFKIVENSNFFILWIGEKTTRRNYSYFHSYFVSNYNSFDIFWHVLPFPLDRIIYKRVKKKKRKSNQSVFFKSISHFLLTEVAEEDPRLITNLKLCNVSCKSLITILNCSTRIIFFRHRW